MLSFLKDQEQENYPQNQKPANNDGQADNDVRQQAGFDQNNTEPGYLTIAAKENQVRKSTILLIVLFGTGALCLWFMVRKSVPAAAKAAVNSEETQIETAIAKLTGVKSEMYSRMDEIVQKFYQFNDVQQVQVSDLIKNPFVIDLSGNSMNSDDLTSREDKFRLESLKQESKRLQLLSILTSNGRNCCMIDDKILYEGDSIRSFKVIKIGEGFVKLASEGNEVILKLAQ